MNSFLHCAAAEAIQDSGIDLGGDNSRIGVNIGSMSSNISKLTEFISDCSRSSFEKINRLSMLHILANIPTATLVTKYKVKGPSSSSSAACATGLTSIIEAVRWIENGEADAVLAGGVEDVYNASCLNSSIRLQAMSTKRYEQPHHSSRPFDEGRSGFILAEGAGVVIVQEATRSKARGAKIYAELVGYGLTSDGYHLTRPVQNGDGVFRSMKRALQQSNLSPEDVDSVNCHATSTPVGDQAQAQAIETLLGSSQASISAFKSNLGHAFGAAGAIQLILGIKSMNEGISPRILNLQNPIPIRLNYNFSNNVRPIRCLLKNALGFGGINCSIVVKNPV